MLTSERVELWSGAAKGGDAVAVRLLSEFPDPWSAVQWAIAHAGPGIYCLAGLNKPYCFKVINTRQFEAAETEMDVLVALEEARKRLAVA